MTTIAAAVRETATRLRAAGIDAADLEAAWLVEAATGLSRAEQAIERGRLLDPAATRALEATLRRREAREPLQLILGATDFYGLHLALRPGVLVPRPETERLVELVLAAAPRPGPRPWRVVDVGCGSGAVALALAAARPDAVVTASDIDPDAVDLTRANAAAHGLAVAVVESDLLADPAVRDAAARAHVLVANLPYLPAADRDEVPPEVRWERDHALYAGADGLAVARRLLRQASATLLPRATVWLELDERNAAALRREALEGGWRGPEPLADLSGRRRFLCLRPPPAAPRVAAPRAG